MTSAPIQRPPQPQVTQNLQNGSPEGASVSEATHPLRLLLLNYEFPPAGGGAGNATQKTAHELAARGHTVHVLTGSSAPTAPVVEPQGVTVYSARSYRKNIHEAGLTAALTYVLSAFWMLRRLARENNYDLYHFYFGLPTGILALYVKWCLNKPYVIALRGSDVPGYDKTRWYLRPLHGLLRPLSKYLWTHSSAITALSNNLRSLAEKTAPTLNIRVIGNGVDQNLFPVKSTKQVNNPIKLVSVCRLVKRKGLDNLILAMKRLSRHGIHLQIIGTGEQESQLKALVQQHNLSQYIEFVGYVPRKALAPYYHSSDLFVLPSLAESFGLVLLEAMSSGLPVVATRTGGIPDTVDVPHGGRLVTPGSADEIHDAILELSQQPQILCEMGEYNAAKTRRRYTWGHIAQSYEATYCEILQASHARQTTPTNASCRN